MSHSEPPNVNHHLKKKSVLPKLDDDMYTTELKQKKMGETVTFKSK